MTNSNRKATRQKFLDAAKRRRRSENVTDTEDGTVYEVRVPSAAGRGRIVTAGIVMGKDGQPDAKRTDPGGMEAKALIECVYEPGTEDRVFDDSDFKALRDELAVGGIFDALAKKALELAGIREPGKELTGPKSESDRTDSSSSESPKPSEAEPSTSSPTH